jgi:hypothetical protein
MKTTELLREVERRRRQSLQDIEIERSWKHAQFAFSSRLLDFFLTNARIDSPQIPRTSDPLIRTDKQFSFIDNPDGTLRTLAAFARLAQLTPHEIFVDQRGSRDIDLCAASVLNVLALAAGRDYRVRFSGAWPTSEAATEIVAVTGLPKALGVPLPRLPNFSTLGLIHGRREANKLSSTKAEKTANQIIKQLDSWYRAYGFQLRAEGKERFGKLIGEVLANAEDHSGRAEWWTCGYLRQKPGLDYGDCHLTFFSFGRSMAESLQELPTDSHLRSRIESLVEAHAQQRFFSSHAWREEDLWTLYALQEGISRHSEADDSRGFGTAEMIEEFQELGRTSDSGTQPRMCVLSGRTHILFDGRYSLRRENSQGEDARRVIAFNDTNDLNRPPDPQSVRALTCSFPGTLISLRFYLDRTYLESIASRT